MQIIYLFVTQQNSLISPLTFYYRLLAAKEAEVACNLSKTQNYRIRCIILSQTHK
jgi:hypothetical protein